MVAVYSTSYKVGTDYTFVPFCYSALTNGGELQFTLWSRSLQRGLHKWILLSATYLKIFIKIQSVQCAYLKYHKDIVDIKCSDEGLSFVELH